MNRNETSCPECEYRLNLGGHPHLGQAIRCPKCQTRLVVVGLNPPELDVALPNGRSTPKKKERRVEAFCPECDHPLRLSPHLRPGYQLLCNGCHTLLQVTGVRPLELEVAPAANVLRSKKFED